MSQSGFRKLAYRLACAGAIPHSRGNSMKWWTSLAIGTLAIIGTVSFAQDQASLAPPIAPPITAPARGSAPLAAMPTPAGPTQLTKADADAWLDGYLPYA